MLYLRASFADKLASNYSIFVTFEYNPYYVNLIKSMSNRAWNSETKEWEVGWDCYTQLIGTLNQNNIPYNGKAFMESVNELQQKVQQMQAIQNQDVNINLNDVEFKTKPFSYQLDGIEYGLNHNRFLLADQPGLGKTMQSLNISTLKRNGKHCLIVVGYKSLLFNWVKEIKIHTDEDAYVFGQRMMKRKKKLKTGTLNERNEDLDNLDKISEFFIITDITTLRQCIKTEYVNKKGKKCKNKTFFFADKIEEWCRKNEIGRIILDESHVFKNFESEQTQALLRIKNCPNKIAMTGTPIMNKNLDLYPIMCWLGYENRNYYEFIDRYCKKGGFKNKQIVGNKNSDELHQRLSQFMLRRLKADVLDLPEKIYIPELLEMDGKQWSFYEKTNKLIKQKLSIQKNNKNALLGATMALRKITCHPQWYDEDCNCVDSVKYDRAMQIIEEAVENGEKIIIYSFFTTPFESNNQLVNFYNRLAKYNPTMIIGDTKDRMEQVEKFQNDPTCKVLVGSIGAMGVGLTLTAANVVIFLDQPWNKAIEDQAIDRAHRVGTKDTVRIYVLMCKGTVDEGVYKTVHKKGRLADEIVDGVTTEELQSILELEEEE